MNGIKASWLGKPIIEYNGNVFYFETQKAIALIAYLGISSPAPSSRENLAALFWPKQDQQHALANLHKTLFSMDHVLGSDFFLMDQDYIVIHPSSQFWQDVGEFHSLLENVRSDNREIAACAEYINNLEKAAALYRGSFLEGITLQDCVEFNAWQNFQRENLSRDLAFTFENLSRTYASQKKIDKAIQKARRWVSLDHLNENAHQLLMRLYIQDGQKDEALHQFEEYSRVMKDELNQSPGNKTMELYRAIQTGGIKKEDSFSGDSSQQPVNESFNQPLIQTKFFIPKIRADLVTRPRLLEKLEQGANRALTLICAPAGYGKTTLLSEWIDNLKRKKPSSNWAICWFSLDQGDNDPVRFLNYLTTALERVNLEVSKETRKLIRSSELLQPTTHLARLINDLQELEQSVLFVLDDYQFINNPVVHDGVSFLIEHIPDNVHVVIATRSDPPIPLSKLRASSQLSEIRADDLRFSAVEAAKFLNKAFGLNLTDEQIAKLENRTEGWIAGLQLAGVSMQGRLDIPKFIDAFSGSHRFIMDYLAEEALNQQSAEIQKYLLQTSILNRLNDSLCNFVLNGGDKENEGTEPNSPMDQLLVSTDNQSQLTRLESLGLFIVPQDDERVWYRYHHLFADLLRTRLHSISPELIPTLHHRASLWFEGNGDFESSINHSLAAGDWDNASRLIGLQIQRLLENGQMTTVMRWIDGFPKDELLKNPKLCIHVAEMYSQAGIIDQIDPLLDNAEEIVTSIDNPGKKLYGTGTQVLNLSPKEIIMIRSMSAILRGLKAICSGQPQHAIDITQAALDSIPEMAPKELAVLFWVQGWAQRSLGNLNLALDLLTKGTEYADASGAILRDIWTDLGNVTRLVGKLPQAIDILNNSLQTADERGIQNQGNLSRDESFLSFCYYEQNQLDQAFMYANRALSHTHWWPSHNIIATANVSLAQILLARNDIEASLNAIQIAEEERKNRLMTPFVHCLVDVTWAQIWLKQGKWNLLNQWERDQISTFESKINKGDWIDEYLELRMIMLVRLWIEKTRLDKKIERYEKGLQLLDRLENNCRSSGRMNSLTVILLYRSIIHFFTDKKEDAFNDLDDCFTLAEPSGYMRIFLDVGESAQILIFDYLNRANVIHKLYAKEILKSFGGLSSAQKYCEGKQEFLTSRENDILQLLVEGCSNREIAERLVLSEGTIKFHIHNILGKLNVNSRTQAIVKARELDLI